MNLGMGGRFVRASPGDLDLLPREPVGRIDHKRADLATDVEHDVLSPDRVLVSVTQLRRRPSTVDCFLIPVGAGGTAPPAPQEDLGGRRAEAVLRNAEVWEAGNEPLRHTGRGRHVVDHPGGGIGDVGVVDQGIGGAGDGAQLDCHRVVKDTASVREAGKVAPQDAVGIAPVLGDGDIARLVSAWR